MFRNLWCARCIRHVRPSKVDSSKNGSAPKFEQFRLRQYPGSAYKYALRGSTCAVLTQTAAYIIETQARRTKRNDVRDICRGAYGPEIEQGVALRTVRCFDWGRSALLRIDKLRCHAEIEAFVELPLRQSVQSSADYQCSDWSEDFFRRVMKYEYAVETFGDQHGEDEFDSEELEVYDYENLYYDHEVDEFDDVSVHTEHNSGANT